MRIHVVKARPIRLSKEQKQARKLSPEEKISQYLGSQVNCTLSKDKAFQMPARGNGVPKITALIAASQKGSKYFVAGDVEGNINIFTRNGTFKTVAHATNYPGGVQGLFSMTGSVIYRAGRDVGFVNLDKGE